MPSARLRSVRGTFQGHEVAFRDDRLVVSVKDGFPVESTLESVSRALASHLNTTAKIDHPKGRRWAIFRFPPLQDAAVRIPELAEKIASDDRIRYAEPAFIGHAAFEPTSEPKYANQAWPDIIDLPGAWDLTFGDASVLLAIIDSGISIESGSDPDHPDLRGARYIVRYGGVNQDYVDGDDKPQDDEEHGHGTHVTGIASAAGDNGVGIAGVNWVSNVYVARVIHANGALRDGEFGSDDLILAVEHLLAYATAVGIGHVVANMSLVINVEAEQLQEIPTMAAGFGGKILFCCGAAEWVKTLDDPRTKIQYPAAFAADYDFFVAVASTYADDTIHQPLGMDHYDAVDLFAPGSDVYSTLPTYPRSHGTEESAKTDYGSNSGASMATPMVAGVASLIWGLNKDLTAAQVIACMKAAADEFTYTRTRDADDNEISETDATHLRLNASRAVASALWSVNLPQSHMIFSEVAPGVPETRPVVFDVECGHDLSFEVVAGSDAGLPASLKVAPTSGAYDPEDGGGTFSGIKVTYTPPAAGDVAFGEFRIRCVETAQEWTVSVTASAVVTEGVGVVLVADRSGSMGEPSGIGTMTRMDVLVESAGILVDTLRVGDGLGVVGFSSNVDEPSPFAEITGTTNREGIKADIATMVPGGTTSIGGGVEKGVDVLSAATQPRRGLIVLTDGHENTAPYIADVMSGVDVPVYAIGMGTAEVIQPASLDALTAATGGDLVLTDTLDDGERYRVAKYVLQMLAGVTGASIVLDPAGMLRLRQVISLPFSLCEDDVECDVTLLTPAPRLVQMVVQTPRGREVDVEAGAHRIVGTHVMAHRFKLPVAREHAGGWQVRLAIAGEKAEAAVRDRAAAMHGRIPSLPYDLIVTTRSSLRMRCQAYATSFRPGATVTLRATLTHRGMPHDSHVKVAAVVRVRDQQYTKVALRRTTAGVFEGAFVASRTGVHTCRVFASGLMRGGDRFQREQTITAHMWHNDPLPADREHARIREGDRRSR